MMRQFYDLGANINQLRGFQQVDPLLQRPSSSSSRELSSWGGSLYSLSDASTGSASSSKPTRITNTRLLSPSLQLRTKSMQTILSAVTPNGNEARPTAKDQARFSLVQANSCDMLL